jgi:transposase-like protein
MKCKNCKSNHIIKNGIIRSQQRYKCKDCEYSFVKGDRRTNEAVAVKKALAVILYALCKASFSMLGRLFGVSRSLTYRWIQKEASTISEPEVSSMIREMEFDEMWHFIKSKKTKDGSLKRWIVAHGELLPGLSAIVILQPSSAYTKKLSI